MSINVQVTRMSSLRGLRHLKDYRQAIQTALPFTGLEKPGDDGVVSFVLVTPASMARLNALHLHHQGTTDVITYDLRGDLFGTQAVPDDEPATLAEIYICPQVAREYAARFGNSPSRELLLYAIHGLLHLAGEDDLTDDARLSMRAAEARVMAALQDAMPDLRYDFMVPGTAT